MSFASELKEHIIGLQYKNSCCRRALLYGILISKGECEDNFSVGFNVDNENTAGFVSELIKQTYSKDAVVAPPKNGGRCKRVTFESKAAHKLIEDSHRSGMPIIEKCPLCHSALFRGVFIASGRLSDPAKQFCLEFSSKNGINLLSELFSNDGLELKTHTRGTEVLLYTKNSGVIEDFLAIADLQDAAFHFMNVKISNDLKNNANRHRNFDTANIMKAVNAAADQYDVINALAKRKLLDKLPEELSQTARLRLLNPDMSLAQLAIHSVPPITKSGITHRMEKILKLGRELLKNKSSGGTN